MDINNRETIHKINKGDLATFEQVFRALYPELCAYANRFLKDLDFAEESVQDVFYNLWEKRGKLAVETSLTSYLYRAVKNKCLQSIEHRAVELKYEQYFKRQKDYDDVDASGPVQISELNEIIKKTLDELPPRCSSIFRLNRFEGLRYKEIAQKLSLSVKTVEANMGKALKLFRENLKDYVEAT